MIGIVVVSHSRALAEAAVELACEMVDERPPIALAAGAGDGFGTDAAAVAEAITAVDAPDGVLVLLDLGSAVLSAEMAREFLPPDVAERVRVSPAPLVEGLVAAVVTAATGAPLDAVLEEAGRGLAAKQDHLGEAADPAASGTPAPPAAPEVVAELPVDTPHGLHARPAARLVGLVRAADATAAVTNLRTGRGPVDARSLSGLVTLAVRQGDRLRFEASGPGAESLTEAVRALAADSWGDRSPGPAAPAAPGPEGAPTPPAAGSGTDVALGPAVVRGGAIDLSGYRPGDAAEERRRSDAAVARALAELAALRRSAAGGPGPAGAVLEAHEALLADPELAGAVAADVAAGAAAPTAWGDRLAALGGELEAMDDPYLRARAEDVRSVRRRVLAALAGPGAPDEAVPADGPPVVLVLRELDAATAATLDPQRVAGVVALAGGDTGHGVLVARARGVPVYPDAGPAAAAVAPGAVIGFDARDRRFFVDPDEDTRRSLREVSAARAAEADRALARAHEPGATADGHPVPVLANVTTPADAGRAVASGAQGCGLLRTEILFGHLDDAPSVDAQAAAFAGIAEAFAGRPVTVRTWDVGGDKPLPFLPAPAEANPFLGERGLRLMRRAPEVLLDQLTAVCRVARDHPVHVMFPMVSTAEEVAWALERLDEAAAAAGGRPAGMRVGVMVEVPAAALAVRRVAQGLDFVSIGTNDLAQYTMAAERGNTAVSALADARHPAVLDLVARVCADVPEGTHVAVCGDLAGDPAAAVVLAGLGVEELSVVPTQVALVKARLREVTLAGARDLARRALACGSADEVRALLAGAAGPADADRAGR
ncbi:phosphoenolpyruvate--protein phosphotransferase [Kocuria oceani]|uniref:Phosphocarrier protein HPr n=1 Tax=Kocuria oceani TaxID=988827 RepID=A0ABV9TJ14_9MICC|nr:phosphoenolpyruvate--protein phosphotransferase [Kocuria oceani]